MSNYKYGMYVKTIAKIKRDIIDGLDDEAIKQKWSINDGQLGFIHDVLLKKAYKKIDRRLTRLEAAQVSKEVVVGSFIFCNDKDFGLGEVISLNSYDLMLVKFQNKELNVMCNRKRMVTVHDKTQRPLRLFVTV